VSNGTLDHHVGKPVENVVPGDIHSTIIFEDGSTIDVPGAISSDIIGQALLTVEGDNPPTLVFGFTQAEQPAVRTAEIPVPPVDPDSGDQPQEGADTVSEEQQTEGTEGEEAKATEGTEEGAEGGAEEQGAEAPKEDPEEASD
jgi:hypothetical protein